MTDEQFNELRAIQFAQLALLKTMEANIRALTDSTLHANANGAQHPNAANPNWKVTKDFVETAKKNA